MNTFRKMIFASSAAVFIMMSTHSFAGGEGIGGRAWVVDQDAPEVNKVENRTSIFDSMETKRDRIRNKGEGIGGRAWIVDQANY